MSDIYAQVAVLSRVTAHLDEHGVEPSGQERYICDTFCRRAAARVMLALDQIERNDDERMVAIAKLAYKRGRVRLRLLRGLTSAPQARLVVLVAAILGTTVVTVDSTVVNVALPAIADDLGGGLAASSGPPTPTCVTLGSLILVGGSLGDIFGERRVFALGVAGFGVTSVFCAVAPTIEVLVWPRALQGVFGALLTPRRWR